MASNEIMSDAELDNVVGGSGIECIAFLSRLQAEGLYTPKTPLIAGNEAAAAKELQSYLDSFKYPTGTGIFEGTKVYGDGTANSYRAVEGYSGDPYQALPLKSISADEIINQIRSLQS